MKIHFIFVFIFLIIQTCFSSCNKKDNDIKDVSETKNLKIDIPVSKENKFYASSSTRNHHPQNVFDYDDKTFWAPVNNGINETLIVYIGNLQTLGKFSECELVIWDGVANIETGNVKYVKPIKYRIEFYVEENLLLEQTISKKKYDGELGYPGYIESKFDFQKLDFEKGTLWVKVIILETEEEGTTAIRDIKLNFKNANPYNAYNELNKFCDAINKQDIKALSNFTNNPTSEVLDQFTSEFVPEDGPGCIMESFEVHSEDIVSLHAVEGGDGGSRAFFKYVDGKWKLFTFSYFSYF